MFGRISEKTTFQQYIIDQTITLLEYWKFKKRIEHLTHMIRHLKDELQQFH